MAQPVSWRKALDQGEDASGQVLRNAVGDPRRIGEPGTQGGYVRRRNHLVDGYVEGCEVCTHLLQRHGSGPQELPRGRSIEACQYDAEPPRDPGLEQLQ